MHKALQKTLREEGIQKKIKTAQTSKELII